MLDLLRAPIRGLRFRRQRRDAIRQAIDAADAARDRRDWTVARARYGEALEIDPALHHIWVQYGHALKELDLLADAEGAYRRSLALFPGVGDTYLQLGHVLKLRGDPGGAERAYATAATLDPQREEATRELREIRLRLAKAPVAPPPAPPPAAASGHALHAALAELGKLVDDRGRPNINAFWSVASDLPASHLSLKFYGYELAERLRSALPVRRGLAATRVGLRSKATTQSDMESDWVAYWCGEYQVPVLFHRKLWELCYVNQALYESGVLHAGSRGLGFGCGTEPNASYFAARGVRVVATDAPPEHVHAQAWKDSNQRLSSREMMFKGELVARGVFDSLVEQRFVDMNAIPTNLAGFDFCWSMCALEHLGSIQKGLEFIENSLRTLRPGGVAVHTTEFNVLSEDETVDNWGTVFFLRRHFIELKARLEAQGHLVMELDFNVGSAPMDRFIDVPPYAHESPIYAQVGWDQDVRHLKLAANGFVVTSFGLIIRKSTQAP